MIGERMAAGQAGVVAMLLEAQESEVRTERAQPLAAGT